MSIQYTVPGFELTTLAILKKIARTDLKLLFLIEKNG